MANEAGCSSDHGFIVSAVLLVPCIKSHGIHLVVLTAADHLREEIRSQLVEVMTPGYASSHPATFCQEILELAPDSLSGLYWIRGTDNRAGHCHCHSANHMYCDMERSCNSVGGGWMRVASIDMTVG